MIITKSIRHKHFIQTKRFFIRFFFYIFLCYFITFCCSVFQFQRRIHGFIIISQGNLWCIIFCRTDSDNIYIFQFFTICCREVCSDLYSIRRRTLALFQITVFVSVVLLFCSDAVRCFLRRSKGNCFDGKCYGRCRLKIYNCFSVAVAPDRIGIHADICTI